MNCISRSIMKRTVSMSQLIPQQKNSVTFLLRVLMYRTIHINNFTDEEIHNTWYNDWETIDIVSDCVKTISLMKGKGESFTSSTLYLRGLECQTPEGKIRRVQDEQWEYVENDMNKIRNLYRLYSKPSHEEAHRIGLEDAEEAVIIYREGDSTPSKVQPYDHRKECHPTKGNVRIWDPLPFDRSNSEWGFSFEKLPERDIWFGYSWFP